MMKKVVWTVPLMLVLAGCYTITAKHRPDSLRAADNPNRVPASELVFDAEVAPALIERGDTLHITLAVTNKTDAPVWRGFASGCIYGFGIWNDRGELVAPPPRICAANAPTVTYAPGEVITAKFQWGWDDPKIGPGTYSVIAGFGPRGEDESAPPVEIRLQ
jgi:hypothetical protein